MKKVFIVFIICLSVCLNFVACENQSQQIKLNQSQQIKLNESNIDKYVNIQLVFGNVEQNISVASLLKEESKYLSCMCYVIISPKSDYSFDSANIVFTVSKNNSEVISTGVTSGWMPIGNSKYSALSGSWQQTIYLDKNGYGIGSVYFEKSGNGSHPLVSNEWFANVLTASGYITEN